MSESSSVKEGTALTSTSPTITEKADCIRLEPGVREKIPLNLLSEARYSPMVHIKRRKKRRVNFRADFDLLYPNQ